MQVSTNADDRELQILYEGISGRVIVWANVVETMAGLLAARASNGGLVPGSESLPPRVRQQLADWPEKYLHDSHMIQLMEKATAAQALHFLSAPGSTFSNQIGEFRNKGLLGVDLEVARQFFNTYTGYVAFHPRKALRGAGRGVSVVGVLAWGREGVSGWW